MSSGVISMFLVSDAIFRATYITEVLHMKLTHQCNNLATNAIQCSMKY